MIKRTFYIPAQSVIRYPYVIAYGMVLSILFFVMHLYSIAPLAYLGCCMLAFTLFSFSEKEQFVFLTFLVPNLFMFKFLNSASAILGYFFVAVSFKYLFVHFHTVKINPCLIAVFGASLLTSMYWNDVNFFITSLRFVLNFFLFFSLGQLFEKKEIEKILVTYMFGTVVTVIMGIVYHVNAGNLYNGLFGGINCGRNYTMALVSPVFSIICLFFIERQVNVVMKLFLAITLFVCLICLILSASRTATIALMFPVVLFISYIFNAKINFKSIKNYVSFVFLFGCVIYFLLLQYVDSIDFLLDRFTKDDFEGGNGRFDLWKYYYECFTDSAVTMLIGNGWVYENNTLAEHNFFIQSLYQIGIIGTGSVCLLFFSTFLTFVKSIRSLAWRSLFPLFVIVFSYFGVSALFSDQLSFLVVFALLVVRCFSSSNEDYNQLSVGVIYEHSTD